VTAKIVIAGAGSIGCYVGGCLALAGKTVTFLARGRVAAALARDGLRVTDLDGRDHRFAAGSLSVEIDPANALSSADIVLVTVKSGATLDMAGLVDRYAPSAAVVISLQNGVEKCLPHCRCLRDATHGAGGNGALQRGAHRACG